MDEEQNAMLYNKRPWVTNIRIVASVAREKEYAGYENQPMFHGLPRFDALTLDTLLSSTK